LPPFLSRLPTDLSAPLSHDDLGAGGTALPTQSGCGGVFALFF